MRKINKIVVHCSATKEGMDYTVADIDSWHRQKKYEMIGYHYVIYRDGSVHVGRPEHMVGAHVRGHNSNSIGICYIGGIGANGRAKDTRTDAQKQALINLITTLKKRYPNAKVCGHRDLSPDLNGNGRVDRNEWSKECPSFDAKEEYKDL